MTRSIRRTTTALLFGFALAATGPTACQYSTGSGDEEFGEPTVDVRDEVTVLADAVGEEGREVFRIGNSGDRPLRITEVSIDESSPFEVTYPTGDPGPAKEDRDDALPLEIPAGENRPVRVRFQPTKSETAEADLQIVSNDPDRPTATVALEGAFGGAPDGTCIGLQPSDSLQFGETPVDSTTEETVTVENCSENVELRLESASAQPEPPFSTDFDGGATIPPGETQSVAVTFAPESTGSSEGTLEIATDPSEGGPLEVQLSGTGIEQPACPEAKATASIEGSSAWDTELQPAPQQTLQLDGTPSTAPDGEIETFNWSVVDRPEDSTSQLTPGSNAAEPTLLLDRRGLYRIELEVVDSNGTASCEKAAIVADVIDPGKLAIELRWNTPADTDQTDNEGADVDLHYLSPQASNWNEAPWDIFWNNRTADWGKQNDSSDDPQMTTDHTVAPGPEEIVHDKPADGNQYTVGVYYYDDKGFGPSYATVKIYIDGNLERKYEDKFLADTFDFWKVAVIEWPTTRIYTRDTTSDGFPSSQ